MEIDTITNKIFFKSNNISTGNNNVFPPSLTNHAIKDTYTTLNSDKQKDISSRIKLLYGLGIAIVASLGIWKGKSIIVSRNATPKILPKATSEATEQAAKLTKLKQSSNLSITDFKQIGIFDKGKAIIDGKEFTGTIEICKEKGTKKIYENGVLKETVRKGQRRLYAPNGKIKVYDDNGVLKKTFYKDGNIAKIIFPKDRGVIKKFVLRPDGSVTEYEFHLLNPHSNVKKYLNGNEVKILNKNTGRKKISRNGVGEPLNLECETKLKKVINGKKVTEYYDDNTKQLTRRDTIIYSDPKAQTFSFKTEPISLIYREDYKHRQKGIHLISGKDSLIHDSKPEVIEKVLSGDKNFIRQTFAYLLDWYKKPGSF